MLTIRKQIFVADYAMSPGTVVVGDGSCQFLHRGDCRKNTRSPHRSVAAVALLFMRDRDKPRGTTFHLKFVLVLTCTIFQFSKWYNNVLVIKYKLKREDDHYIYPSSTINMTLFWRA